MMTMSLLMGQIAPKHVSGSAATIRLHHVFPAAPARTTARLRSDYFDGQALRGAFAQFGGAEKSARSWSAPVPWRFGDELVAAVGFAHYWAEYQWELIAPNHVKTSAAEVAHVIFSVRPALHVW